MAKITKILGFQDEFRFLSNFEEVKVFLEGETDSYPSVEHAYQASKTTNRKLRKIFRQLSAGQAKTLGQNIITRPDWDDEMRIKTMRELLFQKFDSANRDNIELVKKLLKTGDAQIIEGNNWGDTFFGVCDGKGFNHLGKLLMEVRRKLVLEKNVIHNFLLNNTSTKIIADHLQVTEIEVQMKKNAYEQSFTYPSDKTFTQSADWEDALAFIEKNPGEGFHFLSYCGLFPKKYRGQEYEIITIAGEKLTARVDDSRESMSEGLEWQTIGKNRSGNKNRYIVVAWKLLTK
jgi:predicted NAD-dependent protein-ADP-ribosyltransferase YbiA (DUF1768 family)